MNNLWTILAILLGMLFFWFVTRRSSNRLIESFTTAEVELANKILAFMQTPNNYIGYVNLLVSNQNASTNLALLDTYKGFVAKGNSLTANDILAQMNV
jgi:hypothetical protein